VGVDETPNSSEITHTRVEERAGEAQGALEKNAHVGGSAIFWWFLVIFPRNIFGYF
jgi:hypothetical protein